MEDDRCCMTYIQGNDFRSQKQGKLYIFKVVGCNAAMHHFRLFRFIMQDKKEEDQLGSSIDYL